METINILFYTDYSYISENTHLWGLTDLERFIKLKLTPLVNVDITIRNRHLDYNDDKAHVNGATLLTDSQLAPFDELWIFGALQSNTASEPLNELTPEEVSALETWMVSGGVMVTGDHSDGIGGAGCSSSHNAFVNLGAALGRNIPRAGKLRDWDGPPSGCYDGPLEGRDNFNTQEGDDPTLLDITSNQADEKPQTLSLIPPDDPHPLFLYYDETKEEVVHVNCFPDHMHEGKLTPTDEIEAWPAGLPLPSVVARGRDKRFTEEDRFYDLVTVFDGDGVDLGRIVADSSFHHYLNRNLVSIKARNPDRTPEPQSDLDQIAEYYANLALWLAPKEKRDRMAWDLFFRAARHPDVLEEKSNSAPSVGRTALFVVEEETGKSNLYRLLHPSGLESHSKVIDLTSRIFLGAKSDADMEVRREALLGGVIKQYHQAFYDLGISDPGWLEFDPTSPRLVGRGLSGELQRFSKTYLRMMSLHKLATERLQQIGIPDDENTKRMEQKKKMMKENTAMAADAFCAGDWDSDVDGTDDGFFTLRADFTGTHHYPDGSAFEVTWSCKHPSGSHSIEIEEPHVDAADPDNSFQYVFTGEVIEDTSFQKHHTKDGKRKKKKLHLERKSLEAAPLEDDPWDGVKTT